jgi:chlorophyll synthase
MKLTLTIVTAAAALCSAAAFSVSQNGVFSRPASALAMMPKPRTTHTEPLSFFPFESAATATVASSTALSAGKSGPNEEASDGSAGVRQLLGVKGASSAEDNIWKIRLQLTKPVTWIPLVWGVMCGAAASGNYHWMWNPFDPNDRNVLLGLEDAAKGFVAMILAGPFLTGYTQTINDWYDRDIDAINEPYRPIPSGKISEGQVIFQIWFLLLGGLGIAYGLDVWSGHDIPSVLLLSIFGSFISYIYSAPPLKLKQNGWAGNYALGASYISLPWWCGQAVFGTLDRPVYWILYVCVQMCFSASPNQKSRYSLASSNTLFFVLRPILYSIAGLGIAIVNDFKSIEGDREMGLNSLPVAFGVDGAKYICAGSVTLTQLGVAAYLYVIGESTYAAILLCLILPQIYFQATLLLPDPIANDVKYQASAQPFLVFGILATALCVGHHDFSA